jgi:hypothetical protein
MSPSQARALPPRDDRAARKPRATQHANRPASHRLVPQPMKGSFSTVARQALFRQENNVGLAYVLLATLFAFAWLYLALPTWPDTPCRAPRGGRLRRGGQSTALNPTPRRMTRMGHQSPRPHAPPSLTRHMSPAMSRLVDNLIERKLATPRSRARSARAPPGIEPTAIDLVSWPMVAATAMGLPIHKRRWTSVPTTLTSGEQRSPTLD